MRSARRALRFSWQGITLRDKILIFLLIAFETTSFANVARRRRLKRLIGRYAQDNVVCVRFHGHTGARAFLLRAGDNSDYSVASEFFRGGYQYPDFVPEQIVDGGANIGLFTVMAADRFPAAIIDSYEPGADNLRMLERNLAFNGIKARVWKNALWDKEEVLTFRSAAAYIGTVTADGGPAAGEQGAIQVQGILPEVQRDCWMKLDIEGAEYVVMPALFKAGRFPRWLSAELHHFRENANETRQLLKANGYTLIDFPENNDVDLANVAAARR